jgi:hypothetical protein
VESHSHRRPYGYSGPVTGIEYAGSAPGARAAYAVIGRQWALHMQGFCFWAVDVGSSRTTT